MDITDIMTYVRIGETIYPLARTAIDTVLAFAHDNGGNEATIAQLEANKLVIARDRQTVEDELAALDATEPTPPPPPGAPIEP